MISEDQKTIKHMELDKKMRFDTSNYHQTIEKKFALKYNRCKGIVFHLVLDA
jgi:hypothetical protein